MYLGRVSGPYHASLVSPIVGAARAALDEYEEIVTTKVSPFPFQARAHHYDVQRPFGQALAMTDAAQAILFAGLEKYMALCRRWEHDGTPLSVEDSLRVWGMIQRASWPGKPSNSCSTPPVPVPRRRDQRLQRYFRKIAMYHGHISSQSQNMASGIARVHFGLPGTGPFGL